MACLMNKIIVGYINVLPELIESMDKNNVIHEHVRKIVTS